MGPSYSLEKASGKSTNGRHALDKAIKALRPGDTLVTVRLDRLARSIRDLLQIGQPHPQPGVKLRLVQNV